MERELSYQEFIAQRDAFDQAVQKVPGISTVCSASDWQLAAHHTLHAPRETSIWLDGHGDSACWLLACVGPLRPFRWALQPLELSWAFGCPLIGPNVEESVEFLLQILLTQGSRWQVTLLSGIPQGSHLSKQLHKELGRYFQLDTFSGAHCMISDLSEGLDALLSRRSSKFRANLRRAARRAKEAGVTFERIGPDIDAEALFQRILTLEQRSWKYAAGQSIFMTEHYRAFYTKLMIGLAESGRLRALFGRYQGRDVSYIFGGVLGTVYRGFQLSYDDALSHLSLGHLSQWELLQDLADEGITTYDLGMSMDYKRRWCDDELLLENLLIFP